MRYNGSIRFLMDEEEAEFNEYGELLTREQTWGETLPCSISTIKDKRTVRTSDGIERVSSFLVLIPLQPHGFNSILSNHKVRLQRDGEDLGCFEILRSEAVKTQGRIRIEV